MTEATQPGSAETLYGAAKNRLATFEVLLPRVIAATKLAIGVAELIADKRARESGSDDGLEALKMLYAALVALAAGDRPGILIPADEAAGYAMALRVVLDLGANAILSRVHVEALYRLLSRGGEE